MLPGLMKDEKKIAALIVAGPEEKEVQEPKEMVGLDAAAEEIMAAIEAKDPEILKGALKSFMQLCYEEQEGMEDTSEILEKE